MESHLDVCTQSLCDRLNRYIEGRLARHLAFVEERMAANAPLKHRNTVYGFPVVTAQEKELILNPLKKLKRSSRSEVDVDYDAAPQDAFCKDWEAILPRKNPERISPEKPANRRKIGPSQMKLF